METTVDLDVIEFQDWGREYEFEDLDVKTMLDDAESLNGAYSVDVS